MPKKITRWKCEHCNKKVYASKSRIVKHEKICYYNPEVKSCITCGNANLECENNEAWCDVLHKQLFQPGEPVINCPLWKEPEYKEPYGFEDI